MDSPALRNTHLDVAKVSGPANPLRTGGPPAFKMVSVEPLAVSEPGSRWKSHAQIQKAMEGFWGPQFPRAWVSQGFATWA